MSSIGIALEHVSSSPAANAGAMTDSVRIEAAASLVRVFIVVLRMSGKNQFLLARHLEGMTLTLNPR